MIITLLKKKNKARAAVAPIRGKRYLAVCGLLRMQNYRPWDLGPGKVQTTSMALHDSGDCVRRTGQKGRSALVF